MCDLRVARSRTALARGNDKEQKAPVGSEQRLDANQRKIQHDPVVKSCYSIRLAILSDTIPQQSRILEVVRQNVSEQRLCSQVSVLQEALDHVVVVDGGAAAGNKLDELGGKGADLVDFR